MGDAVVKIASADGDEEKHAALTKLDELLSHPETSKGPLLLVTQQQYSSCVRAHHR